MTENSIHSFTQDDYKIIKREVLHQGSFLTLVRYQLTFKLFNGEESAQVMRELLERSNAAAILPYDPLLDEVVLIEQFRPGALSNPQSPWLLEIIAGVFNAQENPEEVVIREAEEEGGCDILDLYPICDYFVSPGGSNEYIHLFCGRIDMSKHRNGARNFFGLQIENEDIRTLILPLDKALALLQEGHLKTAPVIISLQWLQLNRERLKQLWQTN